ncbi:MAG: autotransporter-associated beta strand repeat-containing protein [Opitutaceae bacterium]|nr:autotransporter-associated beta strand repeat-containing protein [Opitutaceae bacterium]
MPHLRKTFLAGLISLVLAAAPLAAAPSLMENLGRGVVAVRSSDTEVFVSWRVLGTDYADTAFNLYRSTDGADPVRLNAEPITGATHFVDATADLTRGQVYTVRPIVFGAEQPAGPGFAVAANVPVQQYLRLPLQQPAGGTSPDGVAYTYSPNDCAVGDLDGDGEYEFVVKWEPSNAKDNSQSGYTGNVFLDGYRLDGTRLWRIDLGVNIRAGAHYTQFQVYDLDGDGRAELACKTAPGTRDGTGAAVLLPGDDPFADYRNSGGYILSGPEYLTVFDGQSGANLATVAYNPPRGSVGSWGDTYGNRVDRFLAGVAYLDGSRPSLVMCRGYYTRAVLVAYDYRDGQLTQRWIFDTNPDGGAAGEFGDYRGQGNHNLSVADVDADGRDEIIYGACAIDDDGRGLYNTTWGHGDALHVSDMAPDRPGLEVFKVNESPSQYGPNAAAMFDAATGALLLGVQASGDIGRGVAFDVDPRYRGYEMWASGGTGGMYTAQLTTANAVLGPRGVEISSGKPSLNFGVWWDGDLLRELLDNVTISKWNWTTSTTANVFQPAGVGSNNGTKATPNLSGDILGDWREEVVWRETGNTALRIYTTTIPTTTRLYTLMHDRQYRLAIAWQNTGYNQPPHPSFFLGDGMAPAPTPDIVTSLSVLLGPPAPQLTAITTDTGASAADLLTNDSSLVLGGTAQPGVTVNITRLGAGLVGTAATDAAGSWSFDYTGTALPDGEVSFVLSATDGANNTGASSAPLVVTIDTAAPDAPAIASISLESGALVFAGTAEPGSRVEVLLAGGGSMGVGVADELGLWSVTHAGPALPAAAYTFAAQATDLAGNTGPESAALAVDTTLGTPVITGIETDTGISTADGVTSDTTLVLQGTADAGATVQLAILGVGPIGSTTADAGGAWSFDYTGTVLDDGERAFVATATASGGSSPSSPAFVVAVDTLAPAIVSINRLNPSAATTSAASLTFRVSFSESVAGLDVADFALVTTGDLAGSIASITPGAPGVFDVEIAPVSGEGTLRLDLAASGTGITDLAGNDLPGGFAGGQTYTRSLTGNGTWTRGATGGAWSANAHWLEGIVGAGVGNTADFSTLELVEDNTVHLDSPRTLGNLVFGDTDIATAASWTIDADGDSTGNVLTLALVSGSPTITVNPLGLGARTTLAVPLAGTQGLTKLGSGPLVLAGANTLTGAININGGTATLPAGAALSNGNAQINLGTGTQLVLDGGSLANNNLITAVSSSLVINSGTANLLDFRTNSDFGGTLRVNGGTVTLRDINVRRNSAASPDFNSGVIIAGGETTVATIGLGTNNSTGAMSVQGGRITATGAVTIANQSSSGRGGALRVLSGSFVSTDTVNGLIITRRANNVGSATFTGGTSSAERIVMGFDATVNSGSATLTVNGGELYVGAGGILVNGSGTFTAAINLSSGTLGALADWSTTRPINLPTGGSIAIRAADAANTPRTITLAGALSGAGGLTKTGAGTLALTAANTHSGATTVAAGLLALDGSLAGSATVQAGAAISGLGTIGGTLTLDPGATLVADPFAATPLGVSGALLSGGAGTRTVQLAPSAAPAMGATYTLATFGSTDLTAADFLLAPTSGYLGVLELDATALRFRVTGVGPTAEYTHWAHLEGLPPDQAGPDDNPAGDGVPNLLKFVLGLDPHAGTPQGIAPTTVQEGDATYPAIVYVRRQALGGVTVQVLVAPDLGFASDLGAVEVSVSDNGDGTELVTVRSAVSTAQQPRQFFRLAATLPEL